MHSGQKTLDNIQVITRYRRVSLAGSNGWCLSPLEGAASAGDLLDLHRLPQGALVEQDG